MATGRRRGRALFLIALILILLLVAVFAVTRLGGNNIIAGDEPEQEPVAVQPTAVPVDVVDIVVTTQDVRRGQDLTSEIIQVVAIPREDYTEGVFFNTLEEVLGSRAKMDMKAHTPLTNALIIHKEASGSMPSFEIPRGMVAISVPVSKLSSVSYGLQKGDHVNLIISLLMVDLDTTTQTRLPNRTGYVIAPGPAAPQENIMNLTAQFYSGMEYTVTSPNSASLMGRIEIEPTLNTPVFIMPSEPQRPRLVSQTLIQDVVVLQVGNFDLNKEQPAAVTTAPPVEEPSSQAQQPTQSAPSEPPPPDVITLIVSPQDAVTINYLMLVGADMNLVMRSAGDDSKFDTEAVTLQFILDQHRIPNPAKLPYGLEPRFDSYPSSIAPFPEPAPREAPGQQ